jgi:hypothetical protein
MKTKLIFIFLGVFLGIAPLHAQEVEGDTVQYFIQTRDGNEYLGTIVFEDEDKLVLLTKIGEITIQHADILSRRLVKGEQFRNGEFWFENPQATRYFWSPNGYGLRKGEAYYQNVWILFNQVAVGVTENFSIGAGVIPLFLVAGAPTPMWLTPKFSFPVIENKLNLGVGALVGTVAGGERSGFGILYGMSTFGTKDKNLTLGFGWGYSADGIANLPTVNIGGMIRTGPRGYFITENYLINSADESFGLLSFGGRRMINRIGLDFGLVLPIDPGLELIAIPWLGLTVPFGSGAQPQKQGFTQ